MMMVRGEMKGTYGRCWTESVVDKDTEVRAVSWMGLAGAQVLLTL
jgi:hypothetical protein